MVQLRKIASLATERSHVVDDDAGERIDYAGPGGMIAGCAKNLNDAWAEEGEVESWWVRHWRFCVEINACVVEGVVEVVGGLVSTIAIVLSFGDLLWAAGDVLECVDEVVVRVMFCA